MVTGVVDSRSCRRVASELPGSRILITGLETGRGTSLVQAFANAGCRLVLHGADRGAPGWRLANAVDVHMLSAPVGSDDETVRFAQAATAVYQGLDCVVNLIRVDPRLQPVSYGGMERAVADTLRTAFHITRVLTSRMQSTWSEGVILNVLIEPPAPTGAAAAFGQITRSALAGFTRSQANQLTNSGIRVNAIAPAAEDCLDEVSGLALYLAGPAGRNLSGMIFDPALAETACL